MADADTTGIVRIAVGNAERSRPGRERKKVSMLEMKPVQNKNLILELFEKENVPFQEGCGAFGISERGDLAGYCLFRLEQSMRMLAVCCDDPFLLDGLVRATLNHGSLSGAAEADFSALEGQMRDRLNKLGYFQKEPLPIEWFFTSCKPCKGVTE